MISQERWGIIISKYYWLKITILIKNFSSLMILLNYFRAVLDDIYEILEVAYELKLAIVRKS